jgi:hypothetical protein
VISGLVQSERLYILQKLYKKVIIPAEVFTELTKLDQQLLSSLQNEWIEVKNVKDVALLTELSILLDPAEAEAISLAKELNADLLLIDEKKGRLIATQLGLQITGILGILIEAKREGYITEVKSIVEALTLRAGVWFKPSLVTEVLKRVNEI